MKLFLIMLLGQMFQTIYCQELSVGAGAGYGTYAMSSVKSFQESELYSKFSPDKLKTVQSFPPYIYYHVQFALNDVSILNIGICAGYNTTGGRNILSDYSGVTGNDQKLNSYSVGVLLEGRVFEFADRNLLITFKLSATSTALEIEDYIQLNNYTNSITTRYTSAGYSIEPGIAYEILTSPFLIRAEINYNFDKSNEFEPKVWGVSPICTPDWSGIRIGISTGYVF